MPSGSANRPRPMVSSSYQCGFTYVAMMAFLAVLGVALAAIGVTWSAQQRREREQDLIRIGSIYAEAIARYYNKAPGSLKRFPPTLESLLLDPRFPGTVRHLRRLYADPTDFKRQWQVVRAPDGGIRGVFVSSDAQPLRNAPLDLGIVQLPAVNHYNEWKFVPKVTP